MVNTGRSTVSIKPGDVLVSGVLKKYDSVSSMVKSGNSFMMKVNEKKY